MNLEPVRVTDPICGMVIDRDQAAAKREYRGTTFYFCSESCRKRFDAEPSGYAEKVRSGH
jgi:Cu+-exporting ATPase